MAGVQADADARADGVGDQREDRVEVFETVAEVVALTRGVLQQDHRLTAAARPQELRDAGGDARQAFGLVGYARMHDEPEQAEAFRPIEFFAERDERLLA